MSAGKTATPPAATHAPSATRVVAQHRASPRRVTPPRHQHALDPGQVADALHLAEALRARQRLDRVGLALAVLEREERRAHVADEPPDHGQAVDVAVQRQRRLVADLAHQHRALLDVGRVGDDGVDLEARGQVAVHELDVQAEPQGVRPRDVERVGADVGGEDLEVRPLVLERQRDRSRARPHVDHAGTGRQAQRGLDEVLGLRPRDQHAAVDVQLDVPEPLDAEDVGDRLTLAPAAREVHERARLGARQLAPRVGDQRRAVDAERRREQDLGVEPRRVAARRGDRDERGVERLADRGRRERAPASNARLLLQPAPLVGVLERVRQLVGLARQDQSRLWTVKLIRWSVTRRCGKL